jgi:hypothetical protein
MNIAIFLSLGALGLTVAGLLFQNFGILSGIKERVASLETKMDLFWKVVEGNMSQLLKSYPTNIRKDILLDKFSKAELNLGEAEELRTIMICEMNKTQKSIKVQKGNIVAYVLVIGRLDQVIHDLMINHKKPLWKRLFSQ